MTALLMRRRTRRLRPARVCCPACNLAGPTLTCRADASAAAEVHDGLHHRGHPTATVREATR